MNPAEPKKPLPSDRDQELEQILRELQSENGWTVARTLFCCLCWAMTILVLMVWLWSAGKMPTVLALFSSLFYVIMGAISIPPSRSKALNRLAEFHDVRTVGVLLDSMGIALGSKSCAIQGLLTELLPHLRTSDTAWLYPRHLRRLCSALELDDADANLPYLFAILSALEHVGNRETAQRLERLIQRGAVTEGQQHLLLAAQDCLHGLTTRLEHSQVSSTLLRPASPSENGEELLRPTPSAPDTAPETLLRPSE